MGNRIHRLRGMRDILPEETATWQRMEKAAAECFALYGYGEIRTPIIEPLKMFRRQLGETTDVVQKQMFTLKASKNDEDDDVAAVLRPEATVSTVRALFSSKTYHFGDTARFWYSGPMFRRERPQKGRLRQFHQIGAEAIGGKNAMLNGSTDATMECEQIFMLARLWRELGVADKLILEINNLGDAGERKKYREKLREYFGKYENDLDETGKLQLKKNPLRLLDSKHKKTAELAADAPRMADSLGAESKSFFDGVKKRLDAGGVKYEERDSLVRGLDYYNLTVFEWAEKDDRRQNAICGGGRYDGLSNQIVSYPLPGCGFAIGAERLLALMEKTQAPAADCYLVVTNADAVEYADKAAEMCRDAGIAVQHHAGGKKIGEQIKRAGELGVPLALIVGDDADGQVKIRRLSDREQKETPLADAAATIKTMLKGKKQKS